MGTSVSLWLQGKAVKFARVTTEWVRILNGGVSVWRCCEASGHLPNTAVGGMNSGSHSPSDDALQSAPYGKEARAPSVGSAPFDGAKWA